MIKAIAKKKKCKKEKWVSEEALQIDEKRREAKGKEEKERHTHLNAEFQRIVRRYKKAFLSNQCKEIEENNKMGKTRDPRIGGGGRRLMGCHLWSCTELDMTEMT